MKLGQRRRLEYDSRFTNKHVGCINSQNVARRCKVFHVNSKTVLTRLVSVEAVRRLNGVSRGFLFFKVPFCQFRIWVPRTRPPSWLVLCMSAGLPAAVESFVTQVLDYVTLREIHHLLTDYFLPVG